MPIRLNAFGGLIPSIHPEKLPDTAAQAALNCNLTRAVLEPISVTSPFTSMTTGGVLNSEIPSADIKKITKPSAPALYTQVIGSPVPIIIGPQRWICQAYNWLTIWAMTYIVHTEDTYGSGVITQAHIVDTAQADELTPFDFNYTEAGLTFAVELPSFSYEFLQNSGGPYRVMGPRFQFDFSSGSSTGGPESSILLPNGTSWVDPILPSGAVPLVDSRGNIYASFQAIDYAGPIYDETLMFDTRSGTREYPPVGMNPTGTFVVALNYSDPTRKHFFYCQTARTSDDEEGPPSELSEEVILRPGQLVTLSTPRPTGYDKGRLYRSTTGGDDFMLLSDVDSPAVLYTDDGAATKTEPLPPYGNHPAPTDAEFIIGSVIHPAQFAAAFYQDHLYLSDFYRFWAWPEEYAIPFQANIDAIALAGNTIIVFVGGKVYGVSGGNPVSMAKFLISDTAPLLDKKTLARIGGTVFWCTYDGVAACTGGEVQIVTKKHYTREQWLALTPANYTAKVADNSLFLEHSTDSHLRIDLDESEIAVTTYTATSGVSLTWKSKKYYFEKKTIFDYARIVADAAVTLKVYADGALIETLAVTSEVPVRFTHAAYANSWEFQIESAVVVRAIEFYDRATLQVDGGIVLTGAQVPLWENIWLKFPADDRFVGGMLTVQGGATVPISFYTAGSTLLTTQNVANGNFFALGRGTEKDEFWRVSAVTQMPIERLELYAAQTVPAQDVIHELHAGAVPPWRLKRYEIADKAILTGAVVHAKTNVTMNLYVDGSVAPTQSIAITTASGGHARIPSLPTCRWIEFDFGNDDDDVVEVILYASPTPTISDGGVQMQKAPCWRGNRFRFADRGTFACGMIGASSYTGLSLRLYADGSLVCTQTVSNGRMFYLPATLAEASLWEVDITAPNGVVDTVVLLPRVRVPTGGSFALTAHDTGFPPWANARYEFPPGVELRSARVKADAYPVSVILRAGTTSATVSVADEKEWLIPDSLTAAGRLQIAFGNESSNVDYSVNAISVYARDVAQADAPVVVLRRSSGVDHWRKRIVLFNEPQRLSALRLAATNYTDVLVYLKIAGTTVHTATPTSNADIALPVNLASAREWEVDVVCPNGEVDELFLYAAPVQAAGDSPVSLTTPPCWLGNRFAFPDRGTFTHGTVFAREFASVTVRLYADGALVYTGSVATGLVFSLGELTQAKEWVLDVESTGQIDAVVLLPRVRVSSSPNVMLLAHDTGFQPWLNSIYAFEAATEFRSATVVADSYPVTLTLRSAGSSWTHTVTGPYEQLLPAMGRISDVRLSFGADDALVKRVELHPVEVIAMGPTGLSMRQADGVRSWLRKTLTFTEPRGFSLFRMVADSYTDATVELKIAGAQVFYSAVADSAPILIPGSVAESLEWELSIVCKGDIHDLALYSPPTPIVGESGINLTNPPFWLGNRFRFADKGVLACGIIEAQAYPVTLTLTADGVQVDSRSIASNAPFYLPDTLANATLWQIDLTSSGQIDQCVLLPRVPGPAQRVSVTAQGVGFAPWANRRYEYQEPTELRSYSVEALSYPVTMSLRTNTGTRDVTVTSSNEALLGDYGLTTWAQLSFGANDLIVRAVDLFEKQVSPVKQTGLVLRSAAGVKSWRRLAFTFPETGSFSVLRIVADAYAAVHVKLSTGGTARYEADVTSDAEVKLSESLPNAREWELDLASSSTVRELHLIGRQYYSLKDGVVLIRRESEPFSWLDKRILTPKPTSFSSLRVLSSAYPVTVNLYHNGSLKATKSIADENAVRLPAMRPERTWSLDAIPAVAGTMVHEVAMGTSMERLRA